MKSLAIEREFGSGGREVGMKVAKEAGISYYDSNLLDKVTERYGDSAHMLNVYDEKWTGSLLFNISMAAGYSQGNEQSKVYQMGYEVADTIKRLHRNGPCVFIGRCATDILKDTNNTLRVFIYSSDEKKRIKRIVETENVSEAEARKMMDKRDRARRNYFRFWTQKDWADRGNYDLELNTSMLSTEECARILLYAMNK
ncbi:MAG: cytidylate kinase-like family protein [Clostridiales bacterium]|uniref:Cytidylate kinase-like family protein n=1 Tax=Candidatus Anaerobutyricum stercoripullorum TaxID=2838456 RepID=A0A9D2BCW6_9FIRM|nr:cytidylate kinase-like family protein [Clostridiales bacterium]HIX71815.1 cytidylate kinase-like family protein [Candidatus Anaerobutyricum stercoripullorum]